MWCHHYIEIISEHNMRFHTKKNYCWLLAIRPIVRASAEKPIVKTTTQDLDNAVITKAKREAIALCFCISAYINICRTII